MFHFDITMEDQRMVISSPTADVGEGEKAQMKCTIFDLPTGKSMETTITATELSSVLAIATHPDGMPVNEEITAAHYAVAEPWCERNGFGESVDKDESKSLLTAIFRPIP